MDDYAENIASARDKDSDAVSEMEAWFAVSGDMDDFIYFGDLTKRHSEK